jgi:hypothetical protein
MNKYLIFVLTLLGPAMTHFDARFVVSVENTISVNISALYSLITCTQSLLQCLARIVSYSVIRQRLEMGAKVYYVCYFTPPIVAWGLTQMPM